MKNITITTLEKLTKAKKSLEAIKAFNDKLLNYPKEEVYYNDGKFELSFNTDGGSTLRGTIYQDINNIKLSKEDKKEIGEFIISKYKQKARNDVQETNKQLATEALGEFEDE